MLRSVGYRTHLIGKWHLGFHQPRFTPERRGFDTAFGYYTGNAEYWNHTSPCWDCGNFTALDLYFANATSWRPVTSAANRCMTLRNPNAERAALARRAMRRACPHAKCLCSCDAHAHAQIARSSSRRRR